LDDEIKVEWASNFNTNPKVKPLGVKIHIFGK